MLKPKIQKLLQPGVSAKLESIQLIASLLGKFRAQTKKSSSEDTNDDNNSRYIA